jgi:hypothetical protein
MTESRFPIPYGDNVVLTLGEQACRVTPGLAQVFYKSAALCADRSVDVSYTSVLAVLSVSSFDLSPVLDKHLAIGIPGLLAQGKFPAFEVSRLLEQEPVNRNLSLGVNFMDLWDFAIRFVQELSKPEDGVVEVRHVLGAYLANSDSVVRLQQARVDVAAAQQDFLQTLREQGSDFGKEAAQWQLRFEQALSASQDADPNPVADSSSPNSVLGDFVSFAEELAGKKEGRAISLTTYFLTDQWTTKDFLEYDRSAYAIYCFLMHPLTSSPFALSVLAPWGGGKSSFMRMLRAYLDPDEVAVDKKAGVSKAVDHERVSLKVGEVLAVLSDPVKWIQGENARLGQADLTHRKVVSRGGKERGTRVTVWLNAWKYQNTEQIWAGLADAIITEVAARLKPDKREVFWLKLNLKRVDVAMLRTRVHQQILQAAYQRTWKWLMWMLGPFTLSLAAFLIFHAQLAIGALNLVVGHLLGYAVAAIPVHLWATKQVKNEEKEKPAFIDFKELMQVPDYATKAGFIHQTTADLQCVFDLLDDQPLVIFIDDLDRCSPAKIAEVFEGVNLFLSGEFPKCIFVLGMDDEMVAAGLDVLYEKQAQKLIDYGHSTSIGWRYLDKFIQMPLVLPSPSGTIRAQYVSKLLASGVDKTIPKEHPPIAPPVVAYSPGFPGYDLPENAREKSKAEMFDAAPLPEPALASAVAPYLVDPNAWYAEVDQRVKEFDQDTGLIEEILTMLPEFLSNPRDLKRWLNVFRYHYFVESGPKHQIDLKLLAVKVGLELQWPDALRSIDRLRTGEDSGKSRLAVFIASATTTETISEWQQALGHEWGVPAAATWTTDQRLYEFLKAPF